MLTTRVRPFEYRIYKKLKVQETNWSKQKLLVAFSGGRDSTVLLNVLLNLRSRLKFTLALAHVTHGLSEDPEVSAYRKRSLLMARKVAKENALECHCIEYKGKILKSEAEFREVREKALQDILEKNGCDFIVFGHHASDLLETRLIRLIRGTGPQGLRAMAFCHEKKLRPLLDCAPEEIANYSLQEKLKWIEDPTNNEDDYLRNWIRNFWLKSLEEKRPGSKAALARSLEQLADALDLSPSEQIEASRPEVILRKDFAALTLVKKRDTLARFILKQGSRDFSRRQIDEILKRLSSPQGAPRKKMSFEIAGLRWTINAEQIRAVRL